jgi:hypothetical protein
MAGDSRLKPRKAEVMERVIVRERESLSMGGLFDVPGGKLKSGNGQSLKVVAILAIE